MARKNMPQCNQINNRPSLAQLLARPDIWQGAQINPEQTAGLDTGFAPLNTLLAHGGWPQGGLIDIVLNRVGCEWLLMQQAVKQYSDQGAYTVLINPPYIPYAVGLAKLGIALDHLLVLQPKQKNDFIACFIEFSRNPACRCILSWGPEKSWLSYKELRKCHLASIEQVGVYTIFRQGNSYQQSSPASLRLSARLQADQLNIQILKQKGKLIVDTLCLDIPEHCLPLEINRCLPKQIRKIQRDRVYESSRKL